MGARRSRHDLRLKIAIIESRRTQRRVALDTRIAEVRLSAIVRGQPATPDEQQRLAKYLNRRITDLFDVDPTADSAMQ
jgi:hypothetical protein